MSTLASIAKLRDQPITPQTAVVEVLGFASPGDGGGGTFRWDASGTYPLCDDIGIVIRSNTNGSGRWCREGFVASAINVKWFGAKGAMARAMTLPRSRRPSTPLDSSG